MDRFIEGKDYELGKAFTVKDEEPDCRKCIHECGEGEVYCEEKDCGPKNNWCKYCRYETKPISEEYKKFLYDSQGNKYPNYDTYINGGGVRADELEEVVKDDKSPEVEKMEQERRDKMLLSEYCEAFDRFLG